MKSLLFLLNRYSFPRKGNILSLGLWIAVAGVALGIIQMMLVLSVMSGMEGFLKKCYTRMTSDMVVIPKDGYAHPEQLMEKFKEYSTIKAATPFGFGQALIMKDRVGGVTTEGLDLATSGDVTPWKEIWQGEPRFDLQEKDPHWIWLGVQLAKKLNVGIGDSVNVFIPGEQGKVIPFTVTAITKFGIYDHDLRTARMDLTTMREIFAPVEIPTLYKLAVKPKVDLDKLGERLLEQLGPRIGVKKWSDVNQNLLKAVLHQKWLLFLCLEIIGVLAAMNVVNLLLMSAHHRRRDIAILRAMGMRFTEVFNFFLVQGMLAGLVGVVVGIGGGFIVCALFDRFQPKLLNESIYNVTRLPVSIELFDVMIIAVVAFILCTVFSVMPAVIAARRRPAVALKDEV